MVIGQGLIPCLIRPHRRSDRATRWRTVVVERLYRSDTLKQPPGLAAGREMEVIGAIATPVDQPGSGAAPVSSRIPLMGMLTQLGREPNS